VDCGDSSENWVCLLCHKIFCSRYVNAHAKAHAEATGHLIACSLSDLSFWDFGQDAYLDVFAIEALHASRPTACVFLDARRGHRASLDARRRYTALHLAKFGAVPTLPTRRTVTTVKDLLDDGATLTLELDETKQP